MALQFQFRLKEIKWLADAFGGMKNFDEQVSFEKIATMQSLEAIDGMIKFIYAGTFCMGDKQPTIEQLENMEYLEAVEHFTLARVAWNKAFARTKEPENFQKPKTRGRPKKS